MSGRTEGGAVPPTFPPEIPTPERRTSPECLSRFAPSSPLHSHVVFRLAGNRVLSVFQLDAVRKQFLADAVRLGPILLEDEGAGRSSRSTSSIPPSEAAISHNSPRPAPQWKRRNCFKSEQCETQPQYLLRGPLTFRRLFCQPVKFLNQRGGVESRRATDCARSAPLRTAAGMPSIAGSRYWTASAQRPRIVFASSSILTAEVDWLL